jgi:beta-lactamase class D
MPQSVYEMLDMQVRPIESQFYNYELVKVTVSPETEFKIYELVLTYNNGGIKQHLVKWTGYDDTFRSWLDASDIKKI